MKTLIKIFRHLHTINSHRNLVMKMCFKCSMYKQGLLHDLSKYSLSELIPSIKYYQGDRSPVGYEKSLKGYSLGWLHHKGRNKHHWEYWVDRKEKDITIEIYPMPFEYMLESVIDRISASKTYKKDSYTDSEPYNFFISSFEYKTMNKDTVIEMEYLLEYLKDNGIKKALEYYKSLYRQYKKTKINPLLYLHQS